MSAGQVKSRIRGIYAVCSGILVGVVSILWLTPLNAVIGVLSGVIVLLVGIAIIICGQQRVDSSIAGIKTFENS